MCQARMRWTFTQRSPMIPKMELQVPGEVPKPLNEPDRELMALVDGMLGQVSCS